MPPEATPAPRRPRPPPKWHRTALPRAGCGRGGPSGRGPGLSPWLRSCQRSFAKSRRTRVPAISPKASARGTSDAGGASGHPAPCALVFVSRKAGHRAGGDVLVGGDVAGQVGGIVVDESQQGRAASVLPGQAEEVQAGNFGDAALVGHLAVACHFGYENPGIVGAVTGGTDHHADIQRAAVGEPDGGPVGAGQPGPEPDALSPERASAT